MEAFLTQRSRCHSGHVDQVCGARFVRAPRRSPVGLQLALCLELRRRQKRCNGPGPWLRQAGPHADGSDRGAKCTARRRAPCRSQDASNDQTIRNFATWSEPRRGQPRRRSPGYCASAPRRLSLRPLCGQL